MKYDHRSQDEYRVYTVKEADIAKDMTRIEEYHFSVGPSRLFLIPHRIIAYVPILVPELIRSMGLRIRNVAVGMLFTLKSSKNNLYM
jgi:hypothetical protein